MNLKQRAKNWQRDFIMNYKRNSFPNFLKYKRKKNYRQIYESAAVFYMSNLTIL